MGLVFDNLEQTRQFWTFFCSAAIIGSSLALIEASKGITQLLGGFLVIMGIIVIGVNLYHMVKPLTDVSQKESTK